MAAPVGRVWPALPIDRITPPKVRTGVQGLLVAVAFGLGPALGYLLHGQLYGLWGGTGAFWGASVVGLAALVVGLVGVRDPIPAASA